MTAFTNIENYYSTSDIRKNYKQLYISSKHDRDIIKKYNIPKSNYVYLTLSKKSKTYKMSTEKYNKARLFVLKEYIDKLVESIKKIIEKVTKDKIILHDHEKFTINGNIHEVDIRGKRDINNIYFRAKDIGKMLNVESISKIFRDNGIYKKDTDYKSLQIVKNNKLSSRRFFTYSGLIKYIFNTQSKNANDIKEQMTKILYVHQFGSKEEKKGMGLKLLGVSVDDLQKVLKATSSVSCIYLITLGTVSDLRESMQINQSVPDSNIVCKFGLTNDLSRRIRENQKIYNLIPGASTRLKYYKYIDNDYLSKAEVFIKNHFKNINAFITYENYKELVTVSAKTLKGDLLCQYNNMSTVYSCKNKELMKVISREEHEKAFMKVTHEKALMKVTHEKALMKAVHEKEIQKVLYENKLLKQSIEIMSLQNQLKNTK